MCCVCLGYLTLNLETHIWTMYTRLPFSWYQWISRY